MRADQSARRLAQLRGRLIELELDGLVVTGSENVRYLSGFSGSLGYLVIGTAAAEIVGDSRYWIQMEAEAPGFTLVRSGPSHGLWALVSERLKASGFRRVGFESQKLTVDQHQRLRAALPSERTLVSTTGLIEELRIVKTPEEVELLRAVGSIAGRAFDRVRTAIRPGLRELDVAFLLEQTFRELGADGPAFESIVAAGERGALPHGRASDRVMQLGDMVVVDFGARAGGYHSDTTRTIVVGTPTAEQTRGERKIINFDETKPLPSYLVAFAVGPFDFVPAGRAGSNRLAARAVGSICRRPAGSRGAGRGGACLRPWTGPRHRPGGARAALSIAERPDHAPSRHGRHQ